MPNDEHEPRDAAATGLGKQADVTGCLPLAQCSGWAAYQWFVLLTLLSASVTIASILLLPLW